MQKVGKKMRFCKGVKLECKAFISLSLCLILAIISVACTATTPSPQISKTAVSQTEWHSYTAQFLNLFDTVTTIKGVTQTEEEFKTATEKLKQELEVYHQLFDIYHEYPDVTSLMAVNAKAGQGPITVDRRLIDLLLFCKEMYTVTKGKTNVAMGAVLKLWHDAREDAELRPEEAEIPKAELLGEAAKHCRIEDLEIDRVASTITLKDPKMRLDVGAIAKGYATERLIEKAVALGLNNVLISVGGNVRGIGFRDGISELWKVGVQDPQDSDKLVVKLPLNDASLVTSGIYERFFEVDGVQYHHIIDPQTLAPKHDYLSVSILTHDSALADALSTGLFNMSLEEGKALIRSLKETEAFWVMADGTYEKTEGFPGKVTK